MRMPRLKIALFVFASTLAAAAWPGLISAQSSRGSSGRATSFGVGGGLTMPTGDYSDCCSTGWNLGGFVQWRQPNQVFGVRGEVQYNRNDIKPEFFSGVGNESGNSGIFNFGVDGVLEVAPQDNAIGWYLLAGVGMYNQKYSVSSFGNTASDSRSEMGFNAGGGLTFRMGGANLFVEGRWHTFKVDNTTFALIPVTVGLRF